MFIFHFLYIFTKIDTSLHSRFLNLNLVINQKVTILHTYIFDNIKFSERQHYKAFKQTI